MNSNQPVILSPVEYEKAVAEMLRASEHGLSGFEVTHREVMQGQDGEYEIDVVARFTALGGDFKVLVECKHHKSPVKRDVVQVLKDRLHSTGSQKGMIFSTSGFQSGAIEYAKAHGIALMRFEDGSTTYLARSQNVVKKPDWIADYAGWMYGVGDDGKETLSVISRDHAEYLDKFLKKP